MSRLFDLFLERHRKDALSAFGTPEIMARARELAPARTGPMRLGVLTVGGTLSDDEVRQLRDRWREGGWSFDDEPLVLPAGAEVVVGVDPAAPDVPEPRFALLELDE